VSSNDSPDGTIVLPDRWQRAKRGVRCGVVFDHRGFEEKRRRADLFCISLRVNYGRRGAVAHRAERKHGLSLRVAKDLWHGTVGSGQRRRNKG